MQSWNLTEIEAPGGTVDPAVLTTDDGARAIAIRLDAGQTMNGHGADMPMEVFNAGNAELDQIVLFLVDAARPFSTPAKFE